MSVHFTFFSFRELLSWRNPRSIPHYWGRSLRGQWVVKRKTSGSRLSRAMRTINEWCRDHRHQPLAEQQQALSQKLRGHCAYYGITGNSGCLSAFRLWVVRAWRYWLSRRNRERGMTWDRFNRPLGRYPLPAAVAIHSTRRQVAYPGDEEPYALMRGRTGLREPRGQPPAATQTGLSCPVFWSWI
jgi:hypothetical protein